jgi:predicted nucleotidyltransferase
MKLTEYPQVDEALSVLLANLQNILGNNLVGLYVYGSLVWGDFDESVSDIDLLAAVKNPINQEEFEKLSQMHQDLIKNHPEWDDRIELQYLSLEALKTFKDKESEVVTISPGEGLEKRMVGKHWLMNWYIVREKGLTLFGPDPKTIIEPVSKKEFIQAVKSHVENWNEWVKDMKNKYAQSYAILTMCRALYAYKNGDQVSKRQAAEWVQKELPQYSELVKNALYWREIGKRDKQEDPENYPKTEEFVNFVREKIINS